MHIGIEFGMQARNGVDYATWLLRRCSAVQIDQRPAMHHAAEYGKILSYSFDIKAHFAIIFAVVRQWRLPKIRVSPQCRTD